MTFCGYIIWSNINAALITAQRLMFSLILCIKSKVQTTCGKILHVGEIISLDAEIVNLKPTYADTA